VNTRWWGPVILYFEDDAEHQPLRGNINAVERICAIDLARMRRRLDNSTDDASAYLQGLRQHYPDLPDDAFVDVVEFNLDAQSNPAQPL